MRGGKPARCFHRLLRDVLYRVQDRNIHNHLTVLGSANGRVNKSGKAKLQQRVFPGGDQRLLRERLQAPRHHRDSVSLPLRLQPLPHQRPSCIQLNIFHILPDSLGYLDGITLQAHIQFLVVDKLLERLLSLLPQILLDGSCVEFDQRISVQHDIGNSHKAGRKRNDIAILLHGEKHVCEQIVLQEPALQLLGEVDPVQPLVVLLPNLVGPACQEPSVRQAERDIDHADGRSKQLFRVIEIIRQLIQIVDIALFLPQNRVVIECLQIAGKGDILVQIGHGYIVVQRCRNRKRGAVWSFAFERCHHVYFLTCQSASPLSYRIELTIPITIGLRPLISFFLRTSSSPLI